MASYDDARSQWTDLFKQSSGRDPNGEDFADFENKWRHTPEFQQSERERTGNIEAGYDTSASGLRYWGSLLSETSGDLQERFKDESNMGGGGGGGSQYSSSGTGGAYGAGDAALSSYLDYLKTRDQASQSQQAQLRQILMGQLGQAQEPISETSPGITEILSGQRLGLQRGADRQRGNAAETRAYDGSGGLGGKAFDSDVSRIQQEQGEADATMTGNVLNRQLQAQEQKIIQLLTLATSLGDAESARLLSTQLSAIQTQLGQSNFYDSQAYNYTALNQQGNLQALLAILGAG